MKKIRKTVSVFYSLPPPSKVIHFIPGTILATVLVFYSFSSLSFSLPRLLYLFLFLLSLPRYPHSVSIWSRSGFIHFQFAELSSTRVPGGYQTAEATVAVVVALTVFRVERWWRWRRWWFRLLARRHR